MIKLGTNILGHSVRAVHCIIKGGDFIDIDEEAVSVMLITETVNFERNERLVKVELEFIEKLDQK